MTGQEGDNPMAPDRSQKKQNLPRHSPAAEKGFRERIRMLFKWAGTFWTPAVGSSASIHCS